MNINIRALVFTYGERAVLDGVTFSIPSGSFTGVIGPNGSGKTTFLKLLSHVLRPAGGAIFLDGRDLAVYAVKELARRMAVVSQDNGGGYLFTVEEIVLMGRAPHLGRFQSETVEDYAIARHALEMTGCLHLRHRAVTELSGGERQRVMIARALAQQPKILLLDEPTSHLDIGYQKEILDLVKTLATRDGLTVVAVLHDLNLAAYYCNELVLLSEGKITACGKPVDVLTAENISRVYSTNVLVTPHPVFGTPMVSLLPGGRETKVHSAFPVHVLAGGGSAGEVLRDLREAGYTVTAGVINIGDSDWEAAKALGIPVVTEAPFSAISPARHRENTETLRRAKAVVLSEIPIGHGNILNLQAAREALSSGIPLFLLEERPEQERDFTGGEGLALLQELKENGALPVKEKTRLYRVLADLFSGDHFNQFGNKAGATVDKQNISEA